MELINLINISLCDLSFYNGDYEDSSVFGCDTLNSYQRFEDACHLHLQYSPEEWAT